MADIQKINEMILNESQFIDKLVNEVSRVIVGQNYMVERLLLSLLADGHVLLEGVPGLAKTLTVHTLANAIKADYQRIQFTPDLLPADILGTMIYNQKTGEVFKNFIHTLNFKGNPDTLSLPTSITYKMKVHTIPPVVKENIVLKEGKHNKIITKTPQGKLNIIQESGLELKGTKFIVRKKGSMTTLNIQELFEPEKYIVGSYDIEVFTFPRTYISDIKVLQSKTNTIKIKQPGLANIYLPSKGIAGIYKVSKKDVALIMNLNQITRKNVYLQPGHYMIVYRPARADQTTMSEEKHFIIKSGHSIIVSLN